MNVLLKRTPAEAMAGQLQSLWAIRLPTVRSHLVWGLPGSRCRVESLGEPGSGETVEGPLLCMADTMGCAVTFLDPLPRLVVGAEFAPGGLQAFLRCSLADGIDPRQALSRVWGDAPVLHGTERLTAAMQHSVAATLEAFEAELRAQWRAPDDRAFPTQDALAALLISEDGAGVADAARRFGLSERQFREKVRSATGLTPKRYARLQRFTRALRCVHRGSTLSDAALAADCGYFDQAHFIHEFKALSGMTPTEYRRRHGEGLHSACLFTVLRQRLAALTRPDTSEERADAAADESRAPA